MRSAIASALVVTAAVGVILGGFFVFWRQTAEKKVEANPILSLDQMESQGLPVFAGQTIDGAPLSVEDFRGKVVLINFWASWCAPCVDEFPSMIKLLEEFPNDMVLIAVSRDRTMEDLKTFLNAFPKIKRSNIYVIWDQKGEIARTYQVDRLPESFLARPDLRLSRKIIGTLQWHTPESLEFIKSLLVKK